MFLACLMSKSSKRPRNDCGGGGDAQECFLMALGASFGDRDHAKHDMVMDDDDFFNVYMSRIMTSLRSLVPAA